MKKVASKPNLKSSKRALLVLSALTAMFFLTSLLMLNAYINRESDHKTQTNDDVAFARIEAYIETLKIRLDNEIPEGKWRINKVCTEPHTKGDVEYYSCIYSAVGQSNQNYVESIKNIIADYSSSSSKIFGREVYGFTSPANASCNFYYTELTIIECSKWSNSARYDLDE